MSKTQASKIFKISRNTINLWLHKRQEKGDYRADDGYQRGYEAKITDLEKFKKFARNMHVRLNGKWQGRGKEKLATKLSAKL